MPLLISLYKITFAFRDGSTQSCAMYGNGFLDAAEYAVLYAPRFAELVKIERI